MIQNEMLSLHFYKENTISINTSYSLMFLYCNQEKINYHNKSYKCLILTPFEVVEINNPRQSLYTCITLKLDYLSTYLDVQTISKLEKREFSKKFMSGFDLYFERFLELIINSSDSFRQLTVSIMFINNLINNLDNRIRKPSVDHSNYRSLIEIQKYIHENYNKNISLSSFSDHFNYSPAYLSRVFKQEIGIGFSDYLKTIKLNNAIKQLINTNQSITDIALLNGFGSSSSFNRIFKEEHQITPSDYRHLYQHIDNKEDDFYEHDKNMVLDEIQSKKQKVHKSIDVSSRLMNKFSPYNQIINIHSMEFLSSSFNISKLNETKELLKCKVIRFELDFHDFLTIKQVQTDLSNVIETLSLNGLMPFISFDLSSTKISSQAEADLMSHKLIRFFISEIKKYNLDQFSQWFFEFKLDDLFDSPLNNYYRSIIKTFVDFLDLALDKNNVVIHIGKLSDVSTSYNFSLLADINIQYLSFDLFIDQYVEDVVDIDYIASKIKKDLDYITSISSQKLKYIISSFDISSELTQSYNDKISKASYLIDFISLVYPYFEMIGMKNTFDTPSDEQNTLLYGGNGIVTVNGLHKNAAHSIILLRKLGSNIIHLDRGLLLAKKSFSDYVMIVSNFTNLLFDYDYYKDNTQENTYFNFENLNKTFSIQLNNINDGSYKIKKYHSKIDQKQLDTILNSFGNVANLQEDELLYLQIESRPELSFLKLDTNNSSLNIEMDLKPNEFALLYIYYQY